MATNRDPERFIGTASFGSERGSNANIKTVEASITCTGATSTAAALIPAGAFILGVTCRVTTAITGATSFTVGDGTDVDKWGALIAIAANTVTSSANFTAGPELYTSAKGVVLTATGSNFTAGVVLVTAHYILVTGPAV